MSRLTLVILVAAGILLAHLAVNHFSTSTPLFNRNNLKLHKDYVQWKQKYGKLYATPNENDWRFKMFADSVELIEKSNEQYNLHAERTGQVLSGPMYEINGFADLSEEEFVSRYTGLDLSKLQEALEETQNELAKMPKSTSVISSTKTHENARNLQQLSFETRTRNQRSCGSCWAFAAVAYAEKEYFLINGQQIDFSQQELVDCDQNSNGCQGGFPHEAMRYMKNKGISKASSYPYVAAAGVCSPSKDKLKFPSTFVPQTTQFDVDTAVSIASRNVWMTTYLSGYSAFRYVSKTDDVFDASANQECSINSNHAVTIIDGKDGVVTILNSWGTEWGVQGVKRVKPCNKNNILGVPSSISHAHLAF